MILWALWDSLKNASYALLSAAVLLAPFYYIFGFENETVFLLAWGVFVVCFSVNFFLDMRFGGDLYRKWLRSR